jgi:hypothetical protein
LYRAVRKSVMVIYNPLVLSMRVPAAEDIICWHIPLRDADNEEADLISEEKSCASQSIIEVRARGELRFPFSLLRSKSATLNTPILPFWEIVN